VQKSAIFPHVSSGIEYAMGAPTSRLRRSVMDKKSGNGERTVKDLPARETQDVKSGRDAATGLPTGKRQHAPV